jgi:putative tricarboxylic transport membrane protein
MRPCAIRNLAGLLVLLAACLPASAQDWPRRPVTLLVPFDAGGSVDRLARGLTQFMPKALGQPMTVVDRVGAGWQIGTTWFLQQPDDGYTLMVTPATPFIPVNILVTGAKYSLDDFTFINGQWTDFTLLVTPKDRPFHSAHDLLDAIKANPGKLSAGIDFGSVGHIATMALMDALGLGPAGVRLVTFDGAGSMRSAPAGGQFDFSVEQGEGGETVRDFIRPLAVFLDHRVPQFDAPPINEVLQPCGISVPLLNGSMRALVAPAGFKKRHPQDYETLVAAYRRTLDIADFQVWLKANHMDGQWIGPERTTTNIRDNFEVLKKYKDLLKN